MSKFYLAGALYTDYQQKERLDEAGILRMKGYKVFNPMESKFNDKSTKPTSEMIFSGDTDGVMTADKVMLDIDTAGLGTAVELGICVAINTIHNMFNEGMTIPEIMSKFPKKEVFGFTTDIRVPGTGNYDGVKVPWGISQYFVGALEHVGKIYTDKALMFKDIEEVK